MLYVFSSFFYQHNILRNADGVRADMRDGALRPSILFRVTVFKLVPFILSRKYCRVILVGARVLFNQAYTDEVVLVPNKPSCFQVAQ